MIDDGLGTNPLVGGDLAKEVPNGPGTGGVQLPLKSDSNLRWAVLMLSCLAMIGESRVPIFGVTSSSCWGVIIFQPFIET